MSCCVECWNVGLRAKCLSLVEEQIGMAERRELLRRWRKRLHRRQTQLLFEDLDARGKPGVQSLQRRDLLHGCRVGS